MKTNREVVNVQIKVPKKLAKKMKIYLAEKELTWNEFLIKPMLSLFPDKKKNS